MTKEEFNEKQEEILKELEAIQKMQNYLGEAVKLLQSFEEASGEYVSMSKANRMTNRWREVEHMIEALMDESHELIKRWQTSKLDKELDEEDEDDEDDEDDEQKRKNEEGIDA